MLKKKDDEKPKDYYYRVFKGKKEDDADYLGIPCDPCIYYADIIADESKFLTDAEHDKVKQYLKPFFYPKRLTPEEQHRQDLLRQDGDKYMRGKDYYLKKIHGSKRTGEFKSTASLLGPVVEVEDLPF